MEKNEIIEIINDFLVDEFETEEEEIKPASNLRETLDLDSLDYVDLVVVIESNFGFKATAEDFQTIASFQDFYDFIENKVHEMKTT